MMSSNIPTELLDSVKDAAEIMQRYPVNACTDISGFGLLGHLREMSLASRVDMEINLSQIPLIQGVRDLVACNIISGGAKKILSYVSPVVKWDKDISMIDKLILCDAQTSGGLLFSIPEEYSIKLLTELKKAGVSHAYRIGSTIGHGDGNINVKKKF